MKKIISIFGVLLTLCWAINVSAQTLLYEAKGNGTSFAVTGGSQSGVFTPTLGTNNSIANGDNITLGASAGYKLATTYSLIPQNSSGMTVVMTLSNVNTANGQLITFNADNNSGVRVVGGLIQGIWGTGFNGTAAGAYPSSGFHTVTIVYNSTDGIEVYVDGGSYIYRNTGLKASSTAVTLFTIGSMANTATAINTGMKIHSVQVYQGKSVMTAAAAALENKIAEANNRIRTTVEGTTPGQFPAGSQATLQTLIDEAVTARSGNDAAKTTATTNLNTGLVTYNNSVVKSGTDKIITLTTGTGGSVVFTNPTGTSPLTVDQAQSVTVTATPSAGYRFAKWVDVTSGTDVDIPGATSASYTYTGTTDITLKAVFVQQYTVTLAIDDANSGAVGTFAGGGNTRTVDAGTSLTANVGTATSGYTFIGWYNGTTLMSGATSYTFSANADVNLTARYTYTRKLNVSTPGETYWYYITSKKGSDLLLKSNGADQAITAETFSVNDAYLWKVVDIAGATYLVNKKDNTYLSGTNESGDFTTSTVDNAKPFTIYASTNHAFAKNSWGIDVTGVGKINARFSSSGTKFCVYGVTSDAGNAFHFIPLEGSGIPQEADINNTWFNINDRNGWTKHNVADGILKDNGTIANFNEAKDETRLFKIKTSTTDNSKYTLVVKEDGVEKEIGWDGTRLTSSSTDIFNFNFKTVVDASNVGNHAIDKITLGTGAGASYLGMTGTTNGGTSVNINVGGNELKHWGGNDIGNGFRFINPDDVLGVKTCTATDTVWYRVISDGYLPQTQYAFGKVWSSDLVGGTMRFVDKANDAAQYFCFVLDASGKVRILNKKTGKYMVSGFNCNDATGELFTISSLGLNSFRITPASGNEIHAQASGATLVKWAGVAGSASAWRFKEVTFKTVTVMPTSATEGTVEITTPTAATSPLTIESSASVTVTATPESGYTFTKWVDATTGVDVDLSTDASYTYNGSDNITLKAVFTEIPKYTITIMPTSGGSVEFDGMPGVTELTDLLEGTSVTAIATNWSGCYFTGWVDNADETLLSTDASYTFTATKDITLKAVFSIPTKVDNNDGSIRPIVVNRAIVAGNLEVKVYTITGVQVQNKNLKAGVYVAKAGGKTYKVNVK